MAEEAQLRQFFKDKRASLSQAQRDAAAQKALQHWQHSAQLNSASVYAAFWSARGELPTNPLLHHLLNEGKTVLLPKICPDNSGHLLFGHYDRNTEMTADSFGIPAPSVTLNSAVAPSTAQVIIVPLVAIDRSGNRLGMGKGYYDRTLAPVLATSRPLLVGWCYEWQIIKEQLSAKPWDIPLNGAVTEAGITWFTPTG